MEQGTKEDLAGSREGRMNYEEEIVKTIISLSGSRSPYDVFCDWIKCLALSISNTTELFHNTLWQTREQEYLKTIRPYEKDAIKFVEMKDLLVMALDEDMTDILGKVYMDSGCGNKNTGQFFTPFHISLMTAQMALSKNVSSDHPAIINEPSCGSGGMIIAAAKILKSRGVEPGRAMRVTAQDLDWKAVYMTYIQLSLLGINAVVIQGDTLEEPVKNIRKYPPERVFRTPMQKGLLI